MSPIAYIVTAFFLLVAGFLFAVILLQSNEATLRYLISNLSVIWLFITPFLTMRLLAEEQRTGTIELLLTNPVREFELVIGKFLGALCFLFFMLLPTLYYPALLYLLGGQAGHRSDGGRLSRCHPAGGRFPGGRPADLVDDREPDDLGLLAFAVLLVLWLADAVANNLGAPMNDIVRYLSITQHFQDFSRGVIDTTHVVYFVSMIAACLVLTVLSLQTRRWR